MELVEKRERSAKKNSCAYSEELAEILPMPHNSLAVCEPCRPEGLALRSRLSAYDVTEVRLSRRERSNRSARPRVTRLRRAASTAKPSKGSNNVHTINRWLPAFSSYF